MLFTHKRIILILVIALFLIGKAYTQETLYRQLQSVYIFNFAKYIRWPEVKQSTDEFKVGIYGNGDIIDVMSQVLKSKKVGGKSIAIKKVSEEDLQNCHIIYLPKSNSKRLESLIDQAPDYGVLIVTEEDLIKKGAAISFLVVDKKLKFKLNESLLDKHGLQPSEGLLRLAEVE